MEHMRVPYHSVGDQTMTAGLSSSTDMVPTTGSGSLTMQQQSAVPVHVLLVQQGEQAQTISQPLQHTQQPQTMQTLGQNIGPNLGSYNVPPSVHIPVSGSSMSSLSTMDITALQVSEGHIIRPGQQTQQQNGEVIMEATVLQSNAAPVVAVSRQRKEKRPYSPDVSACSKKQGGVKQGNKRSRKGRKKTGSSYDPIGPDMGPNGEPFCCDKCKSPYIINPSKIKKMKQHKKKPAPRRKFDPVTHKLLILCNACGLSMDRPRKEKIKPTPPSDDEKEKYLQEARTFAMSLAEGLNEFDAERLYCPHFKMKPCGCLQRFIIGDGDMEESRKRASHLLQLLKDAKHLIHSKGQEGAKQTSEEKDSQKSETEEEEKKGKKQETQNSVNLGKRRSQLYEGFVLVNRQYLREELKLCERATQRVLMYSNNFLHKKLKSDPDRGPRVERKNGKAAKGLLKSIEELANEQCCVENCSKVAATHTKLLESWRRTAGIGQREARKVLAEMLTPSGLKANCYKFISMVTGCSYSTISSVAEQMRRTGGIRDPPEHGLKKWWKMHPKKKSEHGQSHEANGSSSELSAGEQKVESTHIQEASDRPTPGQLNPNTPTMSDGTQLQILSSEELHCLTADEASVQLQIQRQQLLQLQKQLMKQQMQIQQQQQLIEQHLLQSSEVTLDGPLRLQSEDSIISTTVRVQSGEGTLGNVISSRREAQMQHPTQSVLQPQRSSDQLQLSPVSHHKGGTSQEHHQLQLPQLLHILEIPVTEAQPHGGTVISSSAVDSNQSQTISMMTSVGAGEYEPITGVNLGLPGSQNGFSNLVILNESTVDAAAIGIHNISPNVHSTQGTTSATYSQPVSTSGGSGHMNIELVTTHDTQNYTNTPMTSFPHMTPSQMPTSQPLAPSHMNSTQPIMSRPPDHHNAGSYHMYSVGGAMDQTGQIYHYKTGGK